MDNRTQVLVSRIWQKMNDIDKAINEKSNMLFSIRDELVSLLVVDSVADIVDYWITFNEPHVFCMLTYCAGAWPGGNPDMLEVATSALPTGVFNQTMNWIAIAHSKAYDYIHEKRFPTTPYAFLFSIQGMPVSNADAMARI
ncbi:hypothetical protein FXO38_27666 [Capsicum annuum]|nr:hypothetical protein FXO37_33438 [Capsicum annuum]KAF3629469.1 hypothetical protein FXO38_27666 [Capsicum annuum]